MHGEDEKCVQNFGCKIRGKRSLGTPRHRLEGNIKMGLQETKLEGVDWILLAQDINCWYAFVEMVMDLWVL